MATSTKQLNPLGARIRVLDRTADTDAKQDENSDRQPGDHGHADEMTYWSVLRHRYKFRRAVAAAVANAEAAAAAAAVAETVPGVTATEKPVGNMPGHLHPQSANH